MTGLSSEEETCRELEEREGEGTRKAPTSLGEVANVPIESDPSKAIEASRRSKLAGPRSSAQGLRTVD